VRLAVTTIAFTLHVKEKLYKLRFVYLSL